MPLAKIHVLEGRYDESRLGRLSNAVQQGLISGLRYRRTISFRSSMSYRRRSFATRGRSSGSTIRMT